MKSLINNKPFRYFISGITAFIVDTVVLNLIIFLIFKSQGDPLFGLITLPKIISSTVGLFISFNLNRNWTFQSFGKSKKNQSIKMLLSYILSIILGSILITLYLSLFKSQDFIKLNEVILPTLSNFATQATIMILNYFIYKNFVFN